MARETKTEGVGRLGSEGGVGASGNKAAGVSQRERGMELEVGVLFERLLHWVANDGVLDVLEAGDVDRHRRR